VDVAMGHTILALSLFFLFCQNLGQPTKNGGGPFQNGSGLFELQKMFSNTNNHLKNLKKNTAKISVSSSIDSYFLTKNFFDATTL
jgi:hypothetical protein